MTVESVPFLPVSVIIAAYNAAGTLRRAVTSVTAQSRLPAEIIVVDDGSTDGTRAVIEALSREISHPQVRSVRLDINRGAASARNAGWEAATQEFVAFLDADDAWHSRKLEIQHSWLNTHPKVVLCGHRCVVHKEGEPMPDVASGAPPVLHFNLHKFLVANRLSTPTVMVRTAIRNRFKEGKRYSEDYLLWMQIVAAHGAAAFIDLPLAFMFKARYGARGLSADHWRMRLGEIDTFNALRDAKIIGASGWVAVSAWAWLKFASRMLGQAMGFPRQ